MAWTDAYGTATEYRTRIPKSDDSDDDDIDEQIEAISRYVERRCGGRVFNQVAATARTFDGLGGNGVAVDDLVSIDADGFAVDITNDGTFDTAVANDDLLLLPRRASEDEGPFRRVELHPKQTTLSRFPYRRDCIEITGTWGWAAVPKAILEVVYMLVREVRDLEEAGYTLNLQNVDAAVAISPRGPALMRSIMETYGRPRLVL